VHETIKGMRRASGRKGLRMWMIAFREGADA
jgi:hypothetical protein